MMIRITLAALLASTVSAHAADLSGSYICTYGAIGGVVYDKATERWEPSGSDTLVLSEVVRVKLLTPKEETKADVALATYSVTIKKLGDDGPERNCLDDYTAEKTIEEFNGSLVCYSGAEYHFNFENLRFQTHVRGGYMNKPMDFQNAFVAVGTCEKVS